MALHGLIALLDDIAAIADDVAKMTSLATQKAAGIVTDDMAVTAERLVGIRRERELPIVRAVAVGSLRNKLLILVPLALLLNQFAPWAILPLLMIGGLFLCFEGAEKILHPDHGHSTENPIVDYWLGTALNPRIGRFDFKLFFESRPALIGWTVVTM